jgi:hypothetical protein
MKINWQQIVHADNNLIMTQPKAVFPNRLGWVKDNPKIGAVIAFQSQTDFALGKFGFDYIVAAKKTGQLDAAYVLLLRNENGRPQFVNAATVEEMEIMLRDEVLHEGTYGQFWWLRASLTGPEPMPWGALDLDQEM